MPATSPVGIHRFEDLRVWQAAQKQCVRVGELINRPELRRDRQMVDQMNDASLSVSFNIAEVFCAVATKRPHSFLRYAFASNGELKAAYCAGEGRKYIESPDVAALIELNESIAKMLRRWMATLDIARNREGSCGGRDTSRTGNRAARTKNPGPRTD